MEVDLKIFTLNCWGIPLVSKDRSARMKAIAEVLATSSYDIVCLQEVWSGSDFEMIREKVSGALPFSHYFYSGVVGSGICIFSRYCLQEVFFHQWAVNGYIHKLHHGDWYGGKGVGLCRLKINGFNINIYSAHLHAEYDRKCDEYLAHRVLQAYDTAQFIQLTSTSADLVILAGDLNTQSEDLAYRIIVGVTGLMDAFVKNTDRIHMGTNECVNNSYTLQRLSKDECGGKRIDYIMYRPGQNKKIDLLNYCLPLPKRVPNHSFSYSDHEAVAATLRLYKSEFSESPCDKQCLQEVLVEAIEICNTALKRLITQSRMYWFFSVLLFSLLVATMVTGAPFGYTIGYHILRVFLTVAFCFLIVMATLWNWIERNAVVAGKLTMEINLEPAIKERH